MPARERIKILVAEDDELVLDLFVRWLETAGYWVVRARDGERAVEAVRQASPAAIILDVSMPRMDGFQVLSALRGMGLGHVPVLMLTGRQSPEDVRRAISLGARDYVAKPVEGGQLLARVERLLRVSGAQPGRLAAV